MIVRMILITNPTCHGHSLTSVSTPPTILVLLWANPHLQSPEAPPAKSSSHICQLSTTGSGEERGKKMKKDTGWQLWHDRLSELSGQGSETEVWGLVQPQKGTATLRHMWWQDWPSGYLATWSPFRRTNHTNYCTKFCLFRCGELGCSCENFTWIFSLVHFKCECAG